MSFGGGGGGVAGVTAHKHTNAAGEGGSLDTTSLINDTPIFPLMVSL
jgi:hypothetical protein|tara:strand:+ start:302 stop:442 length:141 start_codon:yes stop_codon:yes gene_type:complete